MTIKIVLDQREKSLIEKLPSLEIQLLDIGDIHFYKNDQLILILERKTIDDLCSSILDGRYKEQKGRMIHHCKNCGYIIEGSENPFSKSLKMDTVYGMIINTQLRDRLSVFKSSNITETAKLILKIGKQLEKFDIGDNQNNYQQSLVKSKKKDNIDVKQCFINQLSQIPGISYNIANELSNTYTSIDQLISKIKNGESLNDFKCNGRKLGKKADIIKKYIIDQSS